MHEYGNPIDIQTWNKNHIWLMIFFFLSYSWLNAIKFICGDICSATFWRIVKEKSTEDFAWLPYVTTLLSTSLWSFYGILKPDGLLIVTVNGAGAVLEAIYVILYLIYAPKKTKVTSLFSFCIYVRMCMCARSCA